MEFVTKRLVMRPWREEDAEGLYRYAQDPEVGPRAGWPAHTSVAESRDIIRAVLAKPGTYAITLKATGEVIGAISLMAPNPRLRIAPGDYELGYWIGQPHWGRGYVVEAATGLLDEAFSHPRLTQVWCAYYDGNQQSYRVQAKLGFEPHHTDDDVPCPLLDEMRTEHFTRLTRAAWLARRNGKGAHHDNL